ncbi:STAS domain-containing protein [Roseospira visakhapatnamensis]|uniref:Anti-sigma B factor antagonist n=1 Tax=Roseospira visakhapatnamensis TaxID=390880 RepID=A0A7W6RER7_9PROT|nr:STAS domain-containing protein [Roseospira visakhapatnamensis]MBB4266593.1 anti-sigma B factor antagonist [Roseospira visakhapatnamensis]
MMQVERDDDVIVITVDAARLDAGSATAFHHGASQALKNEKKAVFDLSAVGFMDSTGVGALVGVTKTMRKGGGIAVCGLTPAVKTVFTLLRMDMMFKVKPDRTAAVALLRET